MLSEDGVLGSLSSTGTVLLNALVLVQLIVHLWVQELSLSHLVQAVNGLGLLIVQSDCQVSKEWIVDQNVCQLLVLSCVVEREEVVGAGASGEEPPAYCLTNHFEKKSYHS